jgi:hypothetical protein
MGWKAIRCSEYILTKPRDGPRRFVSEMNGNRNSLPLLPSHDRMSNYQAVCRNPDEGVVGSDLWLLPRP